jgi:hypothetical protein
MEQLDGLMARGQSRFLAKQAVRATTHKQAWTICGGTIHAYTRRNVYQYHALAFLNWARSTHQVTR